MSVDPDEIREYFAQLVERQIASLGWGPRSDAAAKALRNAARIIRADNKYSVNLESE